MHLRSVNIEGLGCFFLSAQSKGETPNPGGGSSLQQSDYKDGASASFFLISFSKAN